MLSTMNRILKITLAIIGIVVALVVGLLSYLGGFSTITIEEKQMGPFYLVYREMKGTDMSQIGIITNELNDVLVKKGYATHKPFDVFYPDGHAEIGFEVDEAEYSRFSAADTSYLSKEIPGQRFMTTTFPWKMVMSYMVGFMKVDPALEAYRKQHGYRKTWAATRHDDDIITYLQPIEQDLFAPQ